MVLGVTPLPTKYPWKTGHRRAVPLSDDFGCSESAREPLQLLKK